MRKENWTMTGLIAPRKRWKRYSLSTGRTPGPTQHAEARVDELTETFDLFSATEIMNAVRKHTNPTYQSEERRGLHAATI